MRNVKEPCLNVQKRNETWQLRHDTDIHQKSLYSSHSAAFSEALGRRSHVGYCYGAFCSSIHLRMKKGGAESSASCGCLQTHGAFPPPTGLVPHR